MPYSSPNSSHCGFNMSDQHVGTFVASSCQNTRSDGSVSEFIPSSFAQNHVQTSGKSLNQSSRRGNGSKKVLPAALTAGLSLEDIDIVKQVEGLAFD